MTACQLDPEELRPANDVFDQAYQQELVLSMRRVGWEGRDLLVEQVLRFSFPEYYAWTGSHRIAAAREAGLETVPCRMLSAAEADEAFVRAGYVKHPHHNWWSAITRAHGRYDRDRLQGLVAAGLTEAADMLRKEIAEENHHGA